MNSPNTQLQRFLGFMVLASLMFALTGAIARLLKDEYASVHLVLFRNVIGVVFVLYWLYTKPPQQQGGRPWLLFFRGFNYAMTKENIQKMVDLFAY